MSISMFFKNRRKKRLRQEIYNLKIEAAKLNSSAESFLKSANQADILRQMPHNMVDTKDFIELSNIAYDSYEHSAIDHQMYINTLDEIKHLEEELKNL